MGNSDEHRDKFFYQEAKPTLLVDDLQVATEFYCDVLGFGKSQKLKLAW